MALAARNLLSYCNVISNRRLCIRRASSSPLVCPVADLEGLTWFFQGQEPPAAAVLAVRQSLESASVWRVVNHGVPDSTIANVRASGRAFFDQPAAQKQCMAVGHMDRSRGWELYPQHYRFHRSWMADPSIHDMGLSSHTEPSSLEGILCERFVCGPPTVCNFSPRADSSSSQSDNRSNRSIEQRKFTPFYDSEWARVFYERNVWPSKEFPALQPSMEAAYSSLEPVAHACLQCLAAAIGKPFDYFDHLVTANAGIKHPEAPLRHHSRLQLNNYPSQLLSVAQGSPRAKQQPPIRARRHFDTSMVTVLARQDHDTSLKNEAVGTNLNSSCEDRHSVLKAGDSGALEVQLPDGSWSCVPTGPSQLTVFVGSLAAVLSNFAVRATTHRVSNPPIICASNSRRLSLGYVLKPDYSASALANEAVWPHHQLSNTQDVAMTEKNIMSKIEESRSRQRWSAPSVGMIGRVGWQNNVMQCKQVSRLEAISSYKAWKVDTFKHLRTASAAAIDTSATKPKFASSD